jgi:2-polyprenyl-6-methoxyphenol hydroxylase-like FAD-dependent oxidoreductase
MSADYDAIVIGARCGGSPTAMLLAHSGYRVLLVDKATFPSDTISTHLVHPPAVAALARWGILERLEATGCPPIARYSFDFGPVTISGSPRPADGAANAYGPRRTVLDALLVEAAVAAGAELREAFTVEEILVEEGRVTGIRGHAKGGRTVTERARVVVGADGKHSLVAKAVQPERYNEAPPLAAAYYAYWSGLPTDVFETYIRAEDDRGWAALPTHDELTCVVQGWPRSQFQANRKDVEGTYMKSFELAPEFAERMRGAKRETRFVGIAGLPGYFHKPYGPGWALVGDAGYHKHPITAFGIVDAFRDAEAVATALDDAFAGRRAYDDAMATYQRARDDEALPIYQLTCEFAKIEPPPLEMQQLIGAMQGNQQAMDDFISVMAGTLPAPEFFATENAARIMAQAAASASHHLAADRRPALTTAPR